jgi:hypothetical protein
LVKLIEDSSIPDFLKAYEKSRLAKVGPQGGVPPWSKLRELFMLYATAPKPVKFCDSDILTEMCNEYSRLHARKLGVTESLEHLKRSDKIETRAAGWSEFQLKKTDATAQRIAMRYALNGDWQYGYGYTFARYNKLKYRLFMPMPFSSMIKQSQFFIPFLGNIQLSLLSEKSSSLFTAWSDKIGFEKCFLLMEDEIRKSHLSNDEILVYFSNDFEKMDTRTATSQYQSFVIPVMQAAHHTRDPELASAMLFTTTAPIICPDGTLVGDHGTASGAEVTNGGECICNDYYQRRFIKILRKLLPHGWRLLVRRFNGDDSALIFAIKIDIELFKAKLFDALKQACEETGFDIQFDKLDISIDFGKYCQNVYWYDRETESIKWMYPLVLILNSIMYPEHQYNPSEWDKDYRDLDIIQKCDNGRNHYLFHEFIDFIMRGTKYPLLGRDEQETKRILGKYPKYRALQSLGERYNRQDYDIRLSPTAEYILSRR